MRINPCSNFFNTKKITEQRKQSASSPAFGRLPVKSSDLLQKISDTGYKFYKEVNLIAPDGSKIKGKSFILDCLSKKCGDISNIITDDRYYELGNLNASRDCCKPNVLRCSIRNHTVKTYLEGNFMSPKFSNKTPDTGVYKGVGKAAYQTMEEYLKKYHPDTDTFEASILNNDSWDFHCKMGFDGDIGDYDMYSIIQILRKKFK